MAASSNIPPRSTRTASPMIEVDETPFWQKPGFIVLALVALLAVLVTVGILVSRGESGDSGRLTIAQLRGDPDRFDNTSITLRGNVESVRQLPVISQYALYTLRDDTGDITVLTFRGVPPHDAGQTVDLNGVFHSKVRLGEQLKQILNNELGALAAAAAEALLPRIPLDVIYVSHESYETVQP